MNRVHSNVRERLEGLSQLALNPGHRTYSDNILHECPSTWTKLNQSTLGRAAGSHPSGHKPNSDKLHSQRADKILTYLAKDLTDLRRRDEVTLPSKHIALRVVSKCRVRQTKLHVLGHGKRTGRLALAHAASHTYSDRCVDDICQA